METKVYMIMLGVLLFLLGFTISGLIYTLQFNKMLDNNIYNSATINYNMPRTKLDIVDDCMNRSLVNTSDCLVSNVKMFYKYVPTLDGLDLNFTNLKENGGDCEYYSELYKDLGNYLGFYTETVIIDVAENKAHVIAIMSDDEGYCVLDQTVYQCFTFGNG